MASVTSLGLHVPIGLRHAVDEQILPPDPSPDLYRWDVIADSAGEDEILTTSTCILWSRGGVFRKSFNFEIEGEPIVQALLAYFPTSQDERVRDGDKPDSTFRDSRPLSKALVVFLKSQAHIFFLSGASHVVHMPFEVESACAGPCGVIIQRKLRTDSLAPVALKFPPVPPNSFVSSQISPPSYSTSRQAFSTAGLGKPKVLPMRLSSTLENMWEPPLGLSDSNWPRLVCLTDPLQELGLVIAQPEKTARAKARRSSIRSPFLDSAEEILHVESIGQVAGVNSNADLVLAVTANRESSTYTVWTLEYLKNEDKFTQRQRQSKRARNSRRRSSMQPGLNSGATTPIHPSLRESFGHTLPVKKTRKSEKLDKSIESALTEPDKAGEINRRQSRRVSSLLARADLSASHERSIFVEHSNVPGKRSESHGSQRGRLSNGIAPISTSATYNQTLNSLLEAPADEALQSLRGTGDIGGFGQLALDDHEFDGFTREVALAKINSIPIENSNVRYSLSETPARNQCKVFIVPGTAFTLDEHGRIPLLVCIQDPLDKRLQLITLHVYPREVDELEGGLRSNDLRGMAVAWGQALRAQNVVDSCKICDGSQTMILILSEGGTGQRQLSIQAPWNGLTTVTLPTFFLDNPYSVGYSRRHASVGTKTRRSIGIERSNSQIDGVGHSRSRGAFDVIDDEGNHHGIQIQLQPSCTQVRRILDVCRCVLPTNQTEKIPAGWWHVMQWLKHENINEKAEMEWSGLTILLFTMFLALDHTEPSANLTQTSKQDGGQRARRSSHNTPYWEALLGSDTPNPAAFPRWMHSRGWGWLLDDVQSRSPGIVNGNIGVRNGFLERHIAYAKRYMSSTMGRHAIGQSGYLPTSLGNPIEKRRSAAWGVAVGLHLLLEEQKLDITTPEHDSLGTEDLKAVFLQIARWLRWHEFISIYELSIQGDVDPAYDLQLDLSPPLPEPGNVPCVFHWIQAQLTGNLAVAFPSLEEVWSTCAQQTRKTGISDERWANLTPRTTLFRRFFKLLKQDSGFHEIALALHTCGLTSAILDSLPEAILVPLQDALSRCQARPSSAWSKGLLELVNRSDLSLIMQPQRITFSSHQSLNPVHIASWDFRVLCETKDEMNTVAVDEVDGAERQMVVQSLFKDDRRLFEAQNLLATFKQRIIRLDSDPSWNEATYLEKQKELVNKIATGTLAIPAGRGMLHYGFRFPLLTQKFTIPGFNLTCTVRPTNVAVNVDKALFTEEKMHWAFFHQGVAYGLAISPQAKGIDTSWILYNKPGNDLNNRHAGFLLALGLNGHLKSVAKWVAFKYLTPKHTMTSIGLLLGLAVSHLGTMDSLITRLLSVHVTKMLPRGAAELNLSHYTQTSGIMGIGMLYCNTQHRRMSEIMMSEIEYVGDEDDEDPLRNEGYRLAAGFALGFINLGKGNDLKGLRDMRITEKLLTFATATKKVELVNVLDRAAAGAVMALTIIFMKTEDHIVARKVNVPESVLQFDYIRPDILLLRTVARNLILWSRIEPTFDWISANLPVDFRHRHRLTGVKKVHSRDLPFFSILAGLCFAIALRFAGSANIKVRDLLAHYLDHFMRIACVPAEKFDAQLTRANARMCVDVLALSSAMVMAGTGDLVVLRRLRALHGRDDPSTTYGSHLAAHMAIGALFLGSGMATFGSSNLAVASLLLAFFPIFPADVQDNRSHLQAFRHFWVLATDSRCLVTRDIATGQPVSLPLTITFKPRMNAAAPNPAVASSRKGGTGRVEAAGDVGLTLREGTVTSRLTPCILPPLEEIATLRIEGAIQGFWSLELDLQKNSRLVQNLRKNQTLYVRRRPPQADAFASTLRALGHTADIIGNGPNNQSVLSAAKDPLDWVFGLSAFDGLTHAERDLVTNHFAGDGGYASTAVDARFVLEDGMDGSSRDSLLGLKLLFEWSDRRGTIDVRSQPNKGKVTPDDLEAGKTGLSESEADDVSWWMRDSVIDMLKGKTWLAGQEED
jgi:anaphase-promoting complex subunit 1